MSSEFPFRLSFILVLCAYTSIRIYFRVKTDSTFKAHHLWAGLRDLWTRRVRYEQPRRVLLRTMVFVVFVVSTLVYSIGPSRLAFAAFGLASGLRWMGAALALLALLLLVWAHHSLGRCWTSHLDLQDDHSLVIRGPYRRIRHPRYTALFTLFTGLSLLSANGVILICTVMMITLLYARIDVEEQVLRDRFPDRYDQYTRQTGRLWPRCFQRSDSQPEG